MKLDPRIRSIDSIRSFNTKNNDCFGKFGYFTNFVKNFDNLDKIRKGNCGFKDGSCFPFYEGDQPFQFFIPDSELLPRKPKEKQYRPYTINEFLDKFHFGDSIILRPKINIKMEFHLVYNGYKAIDDNKIEFYFGPAIFTLLELFQSYERFYCGRWYPFGVEVKE